MKRIIIYLLLFCCIIPEGISQNIVKEPIEAKDTLINRHVTDSSSMVIRKDTWLNRLIYGHIDRTYEKKIDLSFIIAPSYTREAGFGIGGAASGLYRLDRTDSIMQPSDIAISGNASIKGMYVVNINGNNHFRGNKSRLSYKLGFYNQPLYFWGISYDDCAQNPMIKYTRKKLILDADYVYKLTDKFHIGTSLHVNYSDAGKINDISYLKGQKTSYFFTGVGLVLQYDTRDFILNPSRGVYLKLKEVVYPELFSNYNQTLFSTTFIADAYQKLWKGGVIAADLYGKFNEKQTPWSLREELGNSNRMRGYYSGRYIDNNQITAQIELRQHIVSRIGCVGWIGAGSVFPSLKQFKVSNMLPNYGLGLRVEFKHNVNIRVDYGFGKETGGFVFNLAEAF